MPYIVSGSIVLRYELPVCEMLCLLFLFNLFSISTLRNDTNESVILSQDKRSQGRNASTQGSAVQWTMHSVIEVVSLFI